MPALSADVLDIVPDLVALRRDLHQNPELSHRETRTAERVAAFLAASGVAVRTGVGGTGVVPRSAAGGAPSCSVSTWTACRFRC
jgi:hippurate hydrolase